VEIDIDATKNEILKNFEELGIYYDYENRRFFTSDARLYNSGLKRSYIPNSLVDYLAKNPDFSNDFNVKAVHVDNKKLRSIFNSCIEYWSAPVSKHVGRSYDFIVFDNNDKVVGIFGLTDPFIANGMRDKLLGWDRKTAIEMVYYILNAYVLGSIPPYNHFLGAKLVALVAISNEIREFIISQYKRADKRKELVMLETFGVYGKSAIYNRLFGWNFVGYTQGSTTTFLNYKSMRDLFKKVESYMLSKNINTKSLRLFGFGEGAFARVRYVETILNFLGLNASKGFGLKKSYYVAPLAKNYKEFLNKTEDIPDYFDYSLEYLLDYWKSRWLLPRLDRLMDEFDKEGGTYGI
jgi:hypothetical protein